MKSQFFAASSASERPILTAQSNTQYSTPVSLHELVHRLMTGLQPLAMKKGNIILNGIPQTLTVAADENLLAYVLWNLACTAINSTKNECIHIGALTTADRTIICLAGVGTYCYHHITPEYRKLQDAAEKLGGSISLESNADAGDSITFCLSATRAVA